MAAVLRKQYKGAAAQTTISNGLGSGDTSITIAATTGWPSAAGVQFFVVISPGTAVEEKCLATISGSTLTLTRGQDDTSAQSHSSGATIYPVFSADDADEANLLASTLTTRGDLLTMGAGPNFARIAIGAANTVLKSDGTDVSYGTIVAANIASNAVETAKINDNAVTQAKLADRVVGSAELDNLTLNAQTGTTYTLVLADAHKLVTQSNAAGITTTIPPNSSVAFEIGDQVNLLQLGAGQVTVAAGAGVTIRSEGSKLKLKGQYAAGTCVKIATDEWVLVGNLSA
jgi:hypothetical protein